MAGQIRPLNKDVKKAKMKASEQFRATKNLKLVDTGASIKQAAGTDPAARKSRNKQLTAEAAETMAALQEMFYARHQEKLLVILQGMDTSGKDGTINDVFGAINAMGLRVHSFKAPTTLELERDYLWRIHQQVPLKGEIVVFNRSHYEDVLITRIHGLIDEKECKRRYQQIADFERMLAETGTVILKFFLHISKDEQKQRLQDRLDDPDKHWKFDPQDLKERQYWEAYQCAYEEAICKTDFDHAPWYVIPADSKSQRNQLVASIVAERMTALKLKFPPAHPEYAKIKIV